MDFAARCRKNWSMSLASKIKKDVLKMEKWSLNDLTIEELRAISAAQDVTIAAQNVSIKELEEHIRMGAKLA